MVASVEKCNKRRMETLWAHVEALENRSQRNNVHLMGLKDGQEKLRRAIQYMEKIIAKGLGLSGDEFKIERAHHPWAPLLSMNKPLRMVTIFFLHLSAWDSVTSG